MNENETVVYSQAWNDDGSKNWSGWRNCRFTGNSIKIVYNRKSILDLVQALYEGDSNVD